MACCKCSKRQSQLQRPCSLTGQHGRSLGEEEHCRCRRDEVPPSSSSAGPETAGELKRAPPSLLPVPSPTGASLLVAEEPLGGAAVPAPPAKAVLARVPVRELAMEVLAPLALPWPWGTPLRRGGPGLPVGALQGLSPAFV